MGLKFKLFKKPKKEKKKPEKQKKTGKKTTKESDSPKKKEKGGPITDFLPLVQTALNLLNSFRKKLRIRHLQLKLIMASDDPCDLAVGAAKEVRFCHDGSDPDPGDQFDLGSHQ